jgi:RhtB (resistance to homoserine/threonine) family protein
MTDILGTQHLPLFIVSGLLLAITPGQDSLYIIGRSVSQGRRAGLLSVLGIVTGCAVHAVAAAFGLSAILSTSAHAFIAVKLAGAAYLCYRGVQMLIERGDYDHPTEQFARESGLAIFRAGLLTNVLNPKVALFFLAFLPQFVSPDAPSRVVALLFLGAVFIFTGTLWCMLLVWSASAMSRRLRTRSTSGVWLKRATGALFVGLGLRLAVSD